MIAALQLAAHALGSSLGAAYADRLAVLLVSAFVLVALWPTARLLLRVRA